MSRRKRRLTQMTAIDQINVTPLLDLVFLLLIAFMLTMPLMEYGTSVNSPEMNAGALPQDKIRINISLLADGTVEQLCFKFRKKGIPFGFGGIASIGKGILPSEYIIKEHYRLGSGCVILSRSFCDVAKMRHIGMINATFIRGVREIRDLERECEQHSSFFFGNEKEVSRLVNRISKGMLGGPY